MELRNEAGGLDRLASLASETTMAPTFNNMKPVALAVGQDRLRETHRRMVADKTRVFEGALLHSLANLEKQPEPVL